MTPYDFTEIIASTGETRPLMSRPPLLTATRKWAAQVERAVQDADGDADRLADWVLNAMEGYAALHARPVLDTDGSGPSCSHCMAPWPFCGHHHMTSLTTDLKDTSVLRNQDGEFVEVQA